MKVLSLENLEVFETIFSNEDREKHVAILLTIKTFIFRFAKHPELKDKAKLFALTDNWRNDGNFFMTFSRIDTELFVYFDTVNASFDSIKQGLKLLDHSKQICIYAVRNDFHDMLAEFCRESNLNLEVDTDTTCFYIPNEQALSLNYEVPQTFYLSDLKIENVEQINSVWPHKFEGSEDFVSFSIKFHLNIGLFDKDDNLVAWCLLYDNGSLGILQTDASYQRKGFGTVVVKALTKKVATQCGCDVISLVVHANEKSKNLFRKVGFRQLGSHTWYNVTKDKIT